jgi:mandelate racemase
VADRLRIHGVRGRLVRVPMRRPLGTSAAMVRTAPLLLLDLQVDGGAAGRAYLFCYTDPLGHAAAEWLRRLGPELAGAPAEPQGLAEWIAPRLRLPGHRGLVAMVAAGLDMAAWDAVARAAGQPLARLLGSAPMPLPAYNSNGLGLVDAAAAAAQALELLEGGFRAIKMRLGRPTLEDDLAAVRAVRHALPDDGIALMADFNQALSPPDALRRCAALDGEGLAWIEEPVRHDDYATCARLRERLRTPLQMGENFQGPGPMAQALAQGALDFAMPDVERIGGVSGWIEAAALARVHEVPLSSHLFPEVSAQLLCASRTRHWLEYVDWAEPVLARPLAIRDGLALPAEEPGSGIDWNEDAVRRFLAD